MAGASAVEVMAGSGEPGMDAPGMVSLMSKLTADELAEFREYGKLLRFRDAVLSGSHPRIKPSQPPAKPAQNRNPPPASASATATAAAPTPSQPAAERRAVNDGRSVIDNTRLHQANKQLAQVNMASVPGLGTISAGFGSQRPTGSGKPPEINPVLLEKSDDLIKAEIQLQRQRVERSLKEQLEQRRTANKASEQLAELDVADILAKATSLTQATPTVQSTDGTAANASASIESADDDTFYSSRHDTPESLMASRLPNESEDEEMREGSPYEPELDFEPVAQPPPAQAAPGHVPPPQPHPQQASAMVAAQPAPTVTVPGLSIGAGSSTRAYQTPVTEAPGPVQVSAGIRTGELGQAGSTQAGATRDAARGNERVMDQPLARGSPLVRGHDLSPLAPQPTHVLPPAIAREPQSAATETASASQAAPAQVAALRKQPSNGSSPESSPHSNKVTDKKKNRKKKRKADRLAADTTAASPYIKPEPRSPSPLTPQYARPNKRQRHSQQQPLEVQDDEPRYEQRMPAEERYQDSYHPRVVRQERVVGYERAEDYRPRHGEEPILITSPRYERVYYDDYRAPPLSGYPAEHEPVQYVAREVRTARPASRVVEDPYEDGGAAYYRDVRTGSRMSMRPAAYRDRSQSPFGYERPPAAMPPPRAPPRRIIVDAFGREYLEPVRPATVIREELLAEPRAPYERGLPPRAISRRPETFDDEAVAYEPTSPAYAPPRRVVTQPEYSYRETGPNSAMPRHPAEYLPSRPEPAREYIARPSSVRPATEVTRYENVAPAYERFPASVSERPPPPPRDYYRAASALPATAAGHEAPAATRYEAPLGYESAPLDYPPLRPASVRPVVAEPPAARYDVPREYAPRRAEYASPSVPPAGYHQHHPVHPRPHHHEGRMDTMPPPPPDARAYSVAPPGEHIVRREYAPATLPQPPVERYYGRHPPPPQQQGREDEEVVFLERGPVVREAYR